MLLTRLKLISEMQVLKFGGSSVANADNIEKVAKIVESKSKTGSIALIVSALGGITDLLLDCGQLAAEGNEQYKEQLLIIEKRHLDAVRSLVPIAHQSGTLTLVKVFCNELEDICKGIFLLKEFTPITKDRITSYGELLSSSIITARLLNSGVDAIWKDARELIVTDNNHTNAVVNFKLTNEIIAQFFNESKKTVTVIPGFIGADGNGKTTTLGRGGSDYTAAIVAAAIDADSLEIWTDVAGIMTADPRIVKAAKAIPHISYQEAMELSHFGAKVIYPPTIQPVMKKEIPVWIKNTFSPDEYGTLIKSSTGNNESSISGITSINEIALLSLEGNGMIGIPGFSKRLFESLAEQKINVILITQSSSEHSICVGIDQRNALLAKAAIDNMFAYEIETGKVDPLIVENELSIVALVGDNMKNHTGISGKMFSALGRNGINIRAIAQGSSERNISAVVFKKDVKKAVNVLHEDFFETTYKQLHLFLAGVGNVGSKLLAQIEQQQDYLKNHLRLQLKVAGISNSKKMIFNDDGIELSKWKQTIASGEATSIDKFIETIESKNLPNTIFADVTANNEIASVYDVLLERSISVVACNKIACSSSYEYYNKLKQLAREFNASFLFETNVGAGLPIIGTLNDLMRSGDKVNKIQAVLSGTLNFVFNNYNGSKTFTEVVKDAQNEGYTEPDPRLDLSGSDVMRKILILARETGELFEFDNISNSSFLPASCMEGSVEDFYIELAKHETHFLKLYNDAKNAGCKLKFVATYDNGKASTGLQQIPPNHDLFHLNGKDNVVLFYTNRYTDQPLVIKGAGAGAEVTASGVFADIIRAGS